MTIGTITTPLREEDDVLLGYFRADTANGLARSIDGIGLVGGRDAALFERTFDQKNKEIGLTAAAPLIKEINEMLHDIHEQKERVYEIRVVARDRYKIPSDATTISFPLRFGPPPPTPEPITPEPTELERIAGDIAKAVAPEASPARSAAFHRALKIPEQCGANEQNQGFVENYRQAFEQKCAPASQPRMSRPSRRGCVNWIAVWL